MPSMPLGNSLSVVSDPINAIRRTPWMSRANGMISVAIFTTNDFDASLVDVDNDGDLEGIFNRSGERSTVPFPLYKREPGTVSSIRFRTLRRVRCDLLASKMRLDPSGATEVSN